jgi:lysophospholipase L1-like esterase
MLKPSPKYLVTMGDSLTDNQTLGTLPHYLWPALLARKMRAAGVDAYERNNGMNGSRTDQQLAKMALMTQYGTPDYGIIWGGANDQGALSVSGITSSGLVATVTTAVNHSLAVNTLIAISGATQTNYNITARVVTVPTSNTFTYTLLGTATSPATGTITWNIPIAGTQENVAAMVKWLKFGCKGVVLNESALPVANVGDRYVVLVDGSSSGGIDAQASQGLTARIPGAGGNAQTVWECRYSLGGSSVWGRIATAASTPDRCKKIIVGGAQYLNYASNAGDNVNVISGKRFLEGTSTDDTLTGIYSSAYQTLRAAQSATATAEGVPFCDNHDFVSRKIAAGFHTQGSAAEHYAAGNQHFNRYGYTLIAQAYFEKIQAQSGWV